MRLLISGSWVRAPRWATFILLLAIVTTFIIDISHITKISLLHHRFVNSWVVLTGRNIITELQAIHVVTAVLTVVDTDKLFGNIRQGGMQFQGKT